MKKEFTANILFLIGINLLIKPFYALAIDTSVQNIVGPQSYGLFLAIFNFVYIQQIFADLGVQNYNNRNISRNPEKLGEVFPKILGAKIIFTLGFAVIAIITAWFFGYLRYFNEILVWILCSQATLSFLLYLRSNIAGTGRYFADSFISVLDKLILIIWMSYVIWINPDFAEISISYFAKVQFASLFITFVFVLLFTHMKLSKLRLSIDLRFTKKLLVDSLPYATLVLLMAGYSRMDGIMLEQILDDEALEAGRYANSFRLFDTMNNFTFLFAALLLPMFSRMIKRGEAVRELVTWSFKLLSMISLFVILMIYFKGEEIMNFFYVSVDDGFPTTLFLLVIAGFALSLNYIYGTLLTANGSIKRLNIIAIIGFSLNVIVNLLLIPKWYGEGAAMATVLTQFLVLVLQVIYAYRFFALNFSCLDTVKLIVVCGIAFGSFFVICNYWHLNLLLSIGLSGLVMLGSAFGIRYITVKDIIPSFHTFAE